MSSEASIGRALGNRFRIEAAGWLDTVAVLPAPWWRLAFLASFVVLVFVWLGMVVNPWRDDSYAFWNAWRDGQLYPDVWRPVSEYVYSPAFAQAFWPLTNMPWPIVNAGWTALQLAALVWMLGPFGATVALAWPYPYLAGTGTAVWATTNNGNPQLLLAAAITLAVVRWPGAFAFVLLTKVSAGVGVVYFLVRRQWRRLATAIGITVSIVLVSAVITPHLWVEWIRLLVGAAADAGSAEAIAKEQFLPIPLAIRGPVGLAVVVVAGWRNRPWLVPVGCFLALPDIHLGGFAVLTAAPAVWLRTRGHPEDDRRPVLPGYTPA